MRRKLMSILVLGLILLLAADVTAVYASRKGGGRHSSRSATFRSETSGHRRVFAPRKGFAHKRFIHRRPVVIIKTAFPYYYGYPYRNYSYDSTYSSTYNTSYLSLLDIVDMAERGLPDEVIIEEIRRTNSTFNLNSEIINYLKDHNVSDKVIDYMAETSRY